MAHLPETATPTALRAGREEPLAIYAPVLALTLLREGSGGREILVGVRSGATNRFHPDVVSVPTMRVPLPIAECWPPSTARAAGLPGLDYAVEALLARKLGLADCLEAGSCRTRVTRLAAWQGTSLIGEAEGEDVTEDLTMFNAEAFLDAPLAAVPPATASYSQLRWLGVERFARMIETRDPGLFSPDVDPITVCVRGLCMDTTRHMLLR